MNSLTQIAIRCSKSALCVLEHKGYNNIQSLTTDNYSFPVVIADLPSKTFFGTNTACMAAMKPTVYGIAEIIDIL